MIVKVYKVLLIILYAFAIKRSCHTSFTEAVAFVKADHLIRKEIERRVKRKFHTYEESDDPDVKQ